MVIERWPAPRPPASRSRAQELRGWLVGLAGRAALLRGRYGAVTGPIELCCYETVQTRAESLKHTRKCKGGDITMMCFLTNSLRLFSFHRISGISRVLVYLTLYFLKPWRCSVV